MIRDTELCHVERQERQEQGHGNDRGKRAKQANHEVLPPMPIFPPSITTRRRHARCLRKIVCFRMRRSQTTHWTREEEDLDSSLTASDSSSRHPRSESLVIVNRRSDESSDGSSRA